MQIEVKSISKVEKETPAGMEVTVFKCVLKGGDSSSAVKATLTLESPDQKELRYLVDQQIGEQVLLSLESVNRKLTEYQEQKQKSEA